MGLKLELGIEIVRNGTRLMVIDATGSSIVTGDEKWNDDVDNADVTVATLDITYPDLTTETKDFLTLGYFQLPITGSFIYELFKEPNGLEYFPDGKYLFTYTINDSTTSYTDTLTKYFYHNLASGITQLWYRLPEEMSDTTAGDEYMESCILAESLYLALQAHASFGNDTMVLQLAEDITRILTVNDINV